MKHKKIFVCLSAFFLCFSSSAVFAGTLEKTYADFDTKDGAAAGTYEELVSAVTEGKEKIYITNSIDMKDGIQLSLSNQALIGVPSENGELPALNFENMKGENDIVNNKSSDKDAAIRISSQNNEISNLVIEKGHDNGILIKGTNAVHNKITNCILRYNNDSGMQIAGGARGNTIKSVYSYRNCDIFTLGGNADGFAIKLGAGPAKTYDLAEILDGRNYFYDCYSWENSDDAWDSYDKELKDLSEDFQAVGGYWTYRMDYENCMCWNNGTPENAMGYTDYANGVSLDENLPFIMRFKAVSSDDVYSAFVKAYNDKTLIEENTAEAYYKKLDEIFGALPTSKEELLPSQIALENWGGNPNGFKLGSKFTQTNSLRFMKNCIAFDHKRYGFDKNNSGAKLFAENCISFGNNINYHLADYTAYKWENMYGSGGNEPDDLPKAGASVSVSLKDSSDFQKICSDTADIIKAGAVKNKTSVTSLYDDLF